MGSLNLPAGSYVIAVTLIVNNTAQFLFQDNHRVIECYLSPNGYEEPRLFVNGEDTDASSATLSFTTATSQLSPFTASLYCGAHDGGTDQSYVFVFDVRITAIAVDNIQSQ